jgi:hypothetical protein
MRNSIENKLAVVRLMHMPNLFRFVHLLALIVGLILASAGNAHAQYPSGWAHQINLAGTYSFLQANSANFGGRFNVNGGSGSAAFIFSDRIAAIADVGVYHFPELPLKTNSTMYTYLFGARIMSKSVAHAGLFAQILLGGGRLNASSSAIKAGENAFAMGIGGGLDVPFRTHFTIRVIEADYLLTRFANGGGFPAMQNNFRVSSGIIYRFGGR